MLYLQTKTTTNVLGLFKKKAILARGTVIKSKCFLTYFSIKFAMRKKAYGDHSTDDYLV
jgi:hypothetical protein